MIKLFESFLNKDEQQMESVRNTLYNAALHNKILSEEELLNISDECERISNYLKLNSEENNVRKYFREINTLVSLELDRCYCNTEKAELRKLKNKYPLLIPALIIVYNNHIMLGKDLQEELNMKYRSSLTRFLSRIEPYNLMSVRKFGNNTYIFMTEKGRNLLRLEGII